MIFQFRIQLQNIKKPPVWRVVQVPASFSFSKFHEVIQAAFNWGNYHLFQFSPRGYGTYPTIGIPDPAMDIDQVDDCRKVKLKDIFSAEGQKFTYIYDFGDDWMHIITLEKIVQEKRTKADLLNGKGACPPEDCGGPWGYEELKEILKNSKHPEHGRMKEWLGIDEDENWNVDAFNLEAAQSRVRKV